MKTICINGPAEGRFIATDAPSFRYPAIEHAVFALAAMTDVPMPASCPTVEYRKAHFTAESLTEIDSWEIPDERYALAEWVLARTIMRGYYDVQRRQYTVWAVC